MNTQEWHLDEVSLVKFKGDEGKCAFTIPMGELDKQSSRTLIVYFKDSDFTKFKATIHAVETSIDKNNIEHQVITISKYGKSGSVKIKYIDGRLISSEKLEKNTIARTADAGVCVPPPFWELDSDQSGGISRNEWNSSPFPISHSFSTLDFNTDDILDPGEFARVDCLFSCVSCLANICYQNPECNLYCELVGAYCYAAYASACAYQCWW